MGTLMVDCDATNHMLKSIKPFVSSLKPISLIVTTGDAKSNLLAEGMGTIEIICNNKKLRLDDCLYIPKLKYNLLSMLELFKKKISIARNKNQSVLQTHNETLMSGKINNNLMYVDYEITTCLLSKTIQQDVLWHHRLGHHSSKILKLLSLPNEESKCITCKINKSKKQPFSKHFENAKLPLDCIHIDLVGPINPCSNSGFQYFLMIVEQLSRYKIVKFLKRKSDCYQNFVSAKKHMENKQDRKIKKLISDKGGEFQNNDFKNPSEEDGFTHLCTNGNDRTQQVC
ncbi:hypothetical protein O181_061898 [Austropuccinia psidii MF-1]|uniref:Integrase catalytic domain-containing protein n=1 Tax=Austropuccinia psidii MF-1 TaxID=1389203 RepID=A0A9Q3EIV1_9BASI|nr:hypothetical protein [Austropuccinia psidii MF-1]